LADASVEIELDDRDELMAKILKGTDEDFKNVIEELKKSDESEESADPAVEDLVRGVFTTMVHF